MDFQSPLIFIINFIVTNTFQTGLFRNTRKIALLKVQVFKSVELTHFKLDYLEIHEKLPF